MNIGIVSEFDANCCAVVVLLGLGTILVLPLARMPLLKLYILATCHKCSSKVCLLFGPFGPTSLQQKAAV